MTPHRYSVADAYDMVVLQPTTLCNLDCGYCYLPDRKVRRDMTPAIAGRVAADVAVQVGRTERAPVTALWHGGEPTATPLPQFERLLAEFEPLRQCGQLVHAIQTNATLINEAWVDLLKRYGFQVSVSIDGPPDLDAERVTRGGRPAHDAIVRGIRLLKAGGLEVRSICVITAASAHRAAEIIGYLDGLGLTSVGINLEEAEGISVDRPMLDYATARRVWADVLTYYRDTPGAPDRFGIRELKLLSQFLHDGRSVRRDPLPTVMWNGDVVLLSPELAGIKSDTYGDFVAGNILDESIQSILARRNSIRYVAEFDQALAACRASCSYWSMCYGGYASNRYAETGRLNVTETRHCRITRQALVDTAHELAHPVRDAGMRRALAPLLSSGTGRGRPTTDGERCTDGQADA